MIHNSSVRVKSLRMIEVLFILVYELIDDPLIRKTVIGVKSYDDMINDLNCEKPRSPDQISCEPLILRRRGRIT